MEHKSTVEERFGMRRANFVLDPLSDEDADFFADRTDIHVGEIIEHLQVDLATGLPPKRLFWGPYGGGKTHTLEHTMRRLSEMTPIHHVYVECPDLSKRATFVELYREGIMRSMGERFVIGLLEAVRDKVGYAKREELLGRLREMLTDQELARAVAILIDPTEERKLLLWSWISGVPVSRADLGELGQTQDLTSAEPTRLAQIIMILGKLLRDLQNRTLILVLDEMDRMTYVGVDTVIQFRTAFTRLVDPNQRYVSILIGCSATNREQMPDIFHERSPVMSRLGKDACKEIPMLEDEDIEPFMRKIIGYIRDPEADIKVLVETAKAATSEAITADFFPFTAEAVQAIKVSLGNEMTPREITLKMTRCAGKAHNYGKPVITADLVD